MRKFRWRRPSGGKEGGGETGEVAFIGEPVTLPPNSPLPPTFEDLARICAELEAPVNALIAGTYASYTREDYARIGVARLSLGGSLARSVQRTLIDAAEEMLSEGSFSLLKKSVSGAKVDRMLE